MPGYTFRYFANQPSLGVWLSDEQASYVDKRMLLQSGLDLDIYFSLIDPRYPKCFK